MFSPEKLTEIEHEAREIRGKSTTRLPVRVYDVLDREAVKGNVLATKEFIDLTKVKVNVGDSSAVSTEKPGELIVNVARVTAEDTRKKDQEYARVLISDDGVIGYQESLFSRMLECINV